MAKTLVIGVGASQQNVVEKLQQLIPDSRCVNIGLGLYPRNPNIEYYNLAENSGIAKEIVDVGCMPGSTHMMLIERLPEIIEEQREKLREFLRFKPIQQD